MKEQRAQAEFEQKTAESKAEAFAPYLAQFLTGDEEADFKLLSQVGEAHGFSGEAMDYLLGNVAKEYQAQNKEGSTSDILNFKFAKQQGYTGTFTQWQTDEANRKAKETGGGGLTPYQVLSTRNQIEDNLRGNPSVQAFGELVDRKSVV